MDAANKKPEQDSQCTTIAVCIVVLFFCWLNTNTTFAQGARLTSDGKDYSIAHSLTNTPQEFPASQWEVENPGYNRGCVVQWSISSFQHESGPSIRADCDLSVTLIKSGNSSRWSTPTPFDSTNLSKGKQSASVAIASTRRGDAVAELRVRFIQPQISTLAAGRYHTTLTGTITGL